MVRKYKVLIQAFEGDAQKIGKNEGSYTLAYDAFETDLLKLRQAAGGRREANMRAHNSGIRLTEQDSAIIKVMIARGDRQHDIAAWFGVNGGQIGEIAAGGKFRSIVPAERSNIPPSGPYPTGRDATIALNALFAARQAIASAEAIVRQYAN